MDSATFGFQALPERDAEEYVLLATAGNSANDSMEEEFISISRETVGSNIFKKIAKVAFLHLKMSLHLKYTTSMTSPCLVSAVQTK